MRCHSPQPPQQDTELFVELNASLPSRLSPFKALKTPLRSQLCSGRKANFTHIATSVHDTHSQVGRTDSSRARALKHMHTQATNITCFVFCFSLLMSTHVLLCVCYLCVGHRMNLLNFHRQLIGKIETISLFKRSLIRRQNRSQRY